MNKLALYGGKSIRENLLPYTRHTITEDDKKALLDCLQSDYIAGNGPIVRDFEDALCEYTGYKYCVAVNSAVTL